MHGLNYKPIDLTYWGKKDRLMDKIHCKNDRQEYRKSKRLQELKTELRKIEVFGRE